MACFGRSIEERSGSLDQVQNGISTMLELASSVARPIGLDSKKSFLKLRELQEMGL